MNSLVTIFAKVFWCLDDFGAVSHVLQPIFHYFLKTCTQSRHSEVSHHQMLCAKWLLNGPVSFSAVGKSDGRCRESFMAQKRTSEATNGLDVIFHVV